MKITSVHATWVHVPIPPERQHTSDFGKIASFDSVIVKIHADAGLVGWGEAKAGVGSAASSSSGAVVDQTLISSPPKRPCCDPRELPTDP